MGMKDNVAAVRKDVGGNAQDFFVAYFKQFPHHQNVFDGYKGKDVNSLKGTSGFATHTTKVLTMLLDIADRYSGAGSLGGDAATLAKMSQHKTRTVQEYKDLFTTLVPFLEKALGGSFAKGEWVAFGNDLVAALQGAM